MLERDDRLDKLFKGYCKGKRPKGRPQLSQYSYFQLSSIEHCDEVYSGRRLEACPGIEELSAYIEGALSNDEAKAMADHLKACKKCMEKVESALAAIQDMQENRLEKTPDQLSSDTSSKLTKRHRKNPPKE